MKPVTILFLAANPSDRENLRINEERRAIEDQIRQSPHRDRFQLPLPYEPGIQPGQLIETFRRHDPDVVHFAGHGSNANEIILQSAAGGSQTVGSDPLEELFRLQGGGVKLVVLNACYSSSQARAITRHVPCAVGMDRAIPDATAVAVAVAFYQGLAHQESVRKAFDTALLQLKLEDPSTAGTNRDFDPPGRAGKTAVGPDQLVVLHVKEGEDPGHVYVLEPSDPVPEARRPTGREDGAPGTGPQRGAGTGDDETPPEAAGRPALREDYDEIEDVSVFFGRSRELKQLKKMVLDGSVRVIAILGFGGIGKTALSEKLVRSVKPRFECFFRRSLKNAPSIEQVVAECIRFVSGRPDIPLPKDVNGLIGTLVKYLGQHSCLVVLDNAESILLTGHRAGKYREGYEGYGSLIRKVGETVHRSCLLVTSREKPEEIATLERARSPVFAMNLDGLRARDAVKLLKRKGLSAPGDELEALVGRYNGNALALMIASGYIQDTPGGSVASFLRSNVAIVGDIRELVCEQIERVSPLERAVMFWLAINREPTSLENLQSDFSQGRKPGALDDAVNSLNRRSLIMPSGDKFTLQPAVMEFVIEMLVERVCAEVAGGGADLLDEHALVKVQASDYIRESQVRLILTPLTQCLLSRGKTRIPAVVKEKLKELRADEREGYAAGNLLNLLVQANTDLSGFDFSHLTIKQAYLQGVSLHDTNFAHTRFEKCRFTDTFGSVTCVRFSPTEGIVATACGDGTVRFWGEDGALLRVIPAHTDWVRAVAFHPGGDTLASASDDRTIKLSSVQTGQPLRELRGHSDRVFAVTYSPDGDVLASGGADGVVRIWRSFSGELLSALAGHDKAVLAVDFSPPGDTLVSAGEDGLAIIWDLRTHSQLMTYKQHTGHVNAVAFSHDGRHVASGGRDRVVRVWDSTTGATVAELRGHTDAVLCVAFRGDTLELASAGIDGVVRVWDVTAAVAGKSGGVLRKALDGHVNWVNSVAYNRKATALASGGADQTVRLRDADTGYRLKTMQGYGSPVWSLALDSRDAILASGHGDNTIRLWHFHSRTRYRTLSGHTNWVWAVAFCNDELLASGSGDASVRLWNVTTGACLRQLHGHSSGVRGLAVSPDGTRLASCGHDQTIRVWDPTTGECHAVLEGHTNLVESVAFHPDGHTLASGGADQSVALWNVKTHQRECILGTDLGRVRFTKFSPDGRLVAACSDDTTVRIWNLATRECVARLCGHSNRVTSLDFSAGGDLLVTCGVDHTVRLWRVATAECTAILHRHLGHVRTVLFDHAGRSVLSGGLDETINIVNLQTRENPSTIRIDKPYNNMNIANARGLTESQTMALKGLGAVENDPPR